MLENGRVSDRRVEVPEKPLWRQSVFIWRAALFILDLRCLPPVQKSELCFSTTEWSSSEHFFKNSFHLDYVYDTERYAVKSGPISVVQLADFFLNGQPLLPVSYVFYLRYSVWFSSPQIICSIHIVLHLAFSTFVMY